MKLKYNTYYSRTIIYQINKYAYKIKTYIMQYCVHPNNIFPHKK